MIPSIRHPGPAAAERVRVAPSRAEPLSLRLAAGLPLDRAVAAAFAEAGHDGGYLLLSDAPVERLAYVVPAASPDGAHAAWYSAPRSLAGPGRIEEAGVVVGRHRGAPFLHCHGLWRADDGPPAMGHLLAEGTRLARPATVAAWGFPDARFEREPDAETNFELFTPRATSAARDGPALLMRIAPHEDLCDAVARTCRARGVERGRIHGIGSVIGARFADGTEMASYATELLIRDGRVDLAADPPCRLDIAIVGMDGAHREGRLAPRRNPVCVTAEIVVVPERARGGAEAP